MSGNMGNTQNTKQFKLSITVRIYTLEQNHTDQITNIHRNQALLSPTSSTKSLRFNFILQKV